jgi:hypothetical protein
LGALHSEGQIPLEALSLFGLTFDSVMSGAVVRLTGAALVQSVPPMLFLFSLTTVGSTFSVKSD